ncbi:MAG: hypothetical protein HQL97_05135 [Magnetococcales bacterium]|nr:hypothetical protein [Magnetococcales bacterium]
MLTPDNLFDRFDRHGFQGMYQVWDKETQAQFVRFANIIHDAKLDWYFIPSSNGTEIRFGRKDQDSLKGSCLGQIEKIDRPVLKLRTALRDLDKGSHLFNKELVDKFAIILQDHDCSVLGDLNALLPEASKERREQFIKSSRIPHWPNEYTQHVTDTPSNNKAEVSSDLEERFSAWCHFDTKDELENIQCPGIYALAISRHDMAGKYFSFRDNIVYFGMTNSINGLKGRLQQFNNTLTGRKGPGHGGAARFLFDYDDTDNLEQWLYVAIWPFFINSDLSKKYESIQDPDEREKLVEDYRTLGKVAEAEYLVIAEHIKLYGEVPKYNNQKKSPKRKRSLR